MKKIYLSVVCLLISIPLIAQLYVEPEKEVECSVFLAKEGRGRAQQGLEIWDDYIFSCEDGGHVNIGCSQAFCFTKAISDLLDKGPMVSSTIPL